MANENGADGQKLLTSSMLIVAAATIGCIFYFMKAVMVPLVLAVFLSYLMEPGVHLLELKIRVPRGLAVLLALIISGTVLLLLSLLISSSVQSLSENASVYEQNLVKMGDGLMAYLQSKGVPLDGTKLKAELANLPVGSFLASSLNSLVTSLSTLFLVLVFVVYLLTGKRRAADSRPMMREIDRKIRNYIAVKVTMSIATGLVVGLLLWLLGLELAPVFGVLAFLLNFIPSIGSIIATLLPLPLALMQFDSGLRIAMVMLIPGVIQVVIGNVVEPKMMGTSLNLHPITVLLSLIFWGTLWGVPGMVMAAPITAVLKIIMDRIEATRPIGDLMAGKLG